MNTPIAVRIECAKGEILNAMETIQKRHALPPCIMDGVLSSVLAEVRSEAKIELINSTNTMMAEKNEELEKAKKAAKRVLKTAVSTNPTTRSNNLKLIVESYNTLILHLNANHCDYNTTQQKNHF